MKNTVYQIWVILTEKGGLLRCGLVWCELGEEALHGHDVVKAGNLPPIHCDGNFQPEFI
jgi:hypothetical protein